MGVGASVTAQSGEDSVEELPERRAIAPRKQADYPFISYPH